MPKLHYPDSPLGELQEILKASQDEVNCRGLQPFALRLQLSQQAGVCGWVRGGYLIWILYLLLQHLDQGFGSHLHRLGVFLKLVLEVVQVYLKLQETGSDFHQAGLLIEPRLEASIFFCHFWKVQVVFCQYLLAVFT